MDLINFEVNSLSNLSVSISTEKVMDDNCELSYLVRYQKDHECELSSLCDAYGSDKGSLSVDGHPYPWPSHTYADFYRNKFSHCRSLIKRIFECGLGTNNPDMASSMGVHGKPGASLRVWRDYFPSADIFGADIDHQILFQEPRIKTFYVDQLSPASIASMWEQIEVGNFDLMVDDGLHTFEAGRSLFENSIDRLAEHGHYIIEDVNGIDMLQYRNYFADKHYRVSYISLQRIGIALGDNQLVVIQKK